MPIAAADMTPIPPSLATAAANPDNETATPIPPCTMGNFTLRFPMFNACILFVVVFHFIKTEFLYLTPGNPFGECIRKFNNGYLLNNKINLMNVSELILGLKRIGLVTKGIFRDENSKYRCE